MSKKSVFIAFGVLIFIFIVIYTVCEIEKIDKYEVKKQYWVEIYFKNKQRLNDFVDLAREDGYSSFQTIVFSDNSITNIMLRKDIQIKKKNIFEEEPMKSVLTDIGGAGIARVINYSSLGYTRYYFICFDEDRPGSFVGLRYQRDDPNDEAMINENSRIEGNWYFMDETYAVPVEESRFFRWLYNFIKGFESAKKV